MGSWEKIPIKHLVEEIDKKVLFVRIMSDLHVVIVLVFHGPSTHFMSFRARSVNLAALFLGKTST